MPLMSDDAWLNIRNSKHSHNSSFETTHVKLLKRTITYLNETHRKTPFFVNSFVTQQMKLILSGYPEWRIRTTNFNAIDFNQDTEQFLEYKKILLISKCFLTISMRCISLCLIFRPGAINKPKHLQRPESNHSIIKPKLFPIQSTANWCLWGSAILKIQGWRHSSAFLKSKFLLKPLTVTKVKAICTAYLCICTS